MTPPVTPAQRCLVLGGAISFTVALLHLGGGFVNEPIARLCGAPPWVLVMIREHNPLIHLVTFAIAAVLAAFGFYAWSAAGAIRRLPLVRTGAALVAAVYSVRGLLLVPQLVFVAAHPGRMPWPFLAYSAVALVLGLIHTAGLLGRWRPLTAPVE